MNDFLDEMFDLDDDGELDDIEEMEESISLSTCQSCGKYHVWHNNVIIVPKNYSITFKNEKEYPLNLFASLCCNAVRYLCRL